MATAGYRNPQASEYLPNARLKDTARDVFDILVARQEPGGTVRIKQRDLEERLGVPQGHVSRAIGQLRDLGILDSRTRRGMYLIHPLLAGYESEAHMINHLRDPDTPMWPLNFPSGLRPPRRIDPRVGTAFDPDPDPDPDGGEPVTDEGPHPFLRLAG
ncbi:helix-turn-helix transcriptional regulator [Streptomyces noursei]